MTVEQFEILERGLLSVDTTTSADLSMRLGPTLLIENIKEAAYVNEYLRLARRCYGCYPEIKLHPTISCLAAIQAVPDKTGFLEFLQLVGK